MRRFQTSHFKSLVSHFLNIKRWIQLIYDTVFVCSFVINEFNPTFEVQNMGNKVFQNASFQIASFPNRNESYSCLWAVCLLSLKTSIFLSVCRHSALNWV